MKKIFLLLALIVFAGCSEEEKKTAKTCYLNDVQVACATESTSITATAKAAYEIDTDNMTFEILERGNDIVEDVNGNTCEITVDPGMFNLDINFDEMIIEFSKDTSDKVIRFQKISEGDDLYGTWKNLDTEENEVITFRADGTAEFSLTCHF